ncbi:MAG: transglutaminase domain-containing protein [Clostridia bacterium]|nr:transglutaminase domain-containing protein [Clostridia bacterium]
MVFTFRTRKGNYHSTTLTAFLVPVITLVLAIGVSIAAAVMEAKYQEYYEKTCEALVSGRTSITLKKTMLSEMAVKRAVFSTPELFIVDSYSYISMNDTVTYMFNINSYAGDYERNLERFNNAVDSIAGSAPGFSNDREAVKWIHDYIIENYEYDHSLASGNALSMIERGVGTCNGYTSLFSALAKRFGIEYGVKTNSDHTWNAVKLGFKWYHVDVTWDDNGTEPGYDYYLKTDSEFLALDHGGWEDTGVSLAMFEDIRNTLMVISGAVFALLTVLSLLPMVYAYFKK